jgi:hypothetical protein
MGRTSLVISFVFLLALTTWGCTSLPDTSGYTAATILIKSAVASVGDATEAQIISAANAIPESSKHRATAREAADRFRKAWDETVRSMDALIEYAESIEAIVSAGNTGAESAQQVVDAVKKLADSVAIDATTGAMKSVFDTVASTVTFIYSEIGKARAAKTLEQALARSGPVIVRIQELIQKQIADAKVVFEESIGLEHDELTTGANFGIYITRNRELEERKAKILNRLPSIELADPTPDTEKKAAEMKKELQIVNGLLKRIEPYMTTYRKLEADLRQREKAGLSIIGGARTAVAAWSTSHLKLSKAIKERSPVSIDSLLAAVGEVRSLIEKWRQL